MNPFDLDNKIVRIGDSHEQFLTIRHLVQGLAIFGGIGSGKSSGSGRVLSLKLLSKNFGGLVLTVKPDEVDVWKEYCHLTGRTDDLVILEPFGQHRFNFLEYESTNTTENHALTENIVEVLKTVIRAGETKDSGKSDDAFWESALDLLMFNVIDLCKLAYGSVSMGQMYGIVQTIPKADEPDKPADGEKNKPPVNEKKTPFREAMTIARNKVLKQVAELQKAIPAAELQYMKENGQLEAVILDRLPDARLFKFLDEFFIDSLKNLSEKTRSIIDFTFSAFLFRLLREPIYSLFCNGKSTIRPEDCFDGKIILINLPVKEYHKVGRDCQILFKYIWQRAMEKRKVEETSRPVFLWADEAQHFIHEKDADFQATARSSKIATVYLTQNLPNYYAAMGGQKAEYRVKSFLGTLATKIFHANADIETNKYGSELIGEAYVKDESQGTTISEKYTESRNTSIILERVIRPEIFNTLRTGGKPNNHQVQAIMHKQGDAPGTQKNYFKMTFNQKFKP